MHTQDLVEVILKTRSETRNSDTVLYVQLINEFRHAGITNEQLQIMLSIPYETVSRIARDFRHKGMYLGDEDIQAEREAKRKEFEEKYGSDGRKHLLTVMAKIRQKETQNINNDLPF